MMPSSAHAIALDCQVATSPAKKSGRQEVYQEAKCRTQLYADGPLTTHQQRFDKNCLRIVAGA
jgi:hypothetical protein